MQRTKKILLIIALLSFIGSTCIVAKQLVPRPKDHAIADTRQVTKQLSPSVHEEDLDEELPYETMLNSDIYSITEQMTFPFLRRGNIHL